jgi:hypothetical protein
MRKLSRPSGTLLRVQGMQIPAGPIIAGLDMGSFAAAAALLAAVLMLAPAAVGSGRGIGERGGVFGRSDE